MGLGSFIGGNAQAKSANKAAKRFIEYQEGQRNLFLDNPFTQGLSSKLLEYSTGKSGYDEPTLSAMRSGVYEDYGKSLKDMNRNLGKTGVMPGGGYAPGRKDRAARLLGENIGTQRAESLRGITKENFELGLDNQRWAASIAPTYLPGLPATPAIPYQVFRDQAAKGPSWAEFGGNLFDTGINAGLGYISGGPQGAAEAGAKSYNNPSWAGRYY